MKKRPSILVLLIFLCLIFVTNISAKQYQDRKYKFTIDVLDTWSFNNYMDGTDMIYDFLSPDQNVSIQIRSFKADAGLSLNLLTQVFEENYLPSGSVKQDLLSKPSSNGIPGMQGSYISTYNGIEIGISVFYAIQNGQGYTLMVALPTSMFQQKYEVVSSILKTFIIPGYDIKTESKPSSGGLGGIANQVGGNNSSESVTTNEIASFSAVKLKNVRMGNQLSGKTNLLNVTNTFNPNTETLYIVYDWESEGANTHEMKIAWIFDQNNYTIDEYVYNFPDFETQGSSNALLSKPYEGWPVGDYHIAFSIGGEIVFEQAFVVSEDNQQMEADFGGDQEENTQFAAKQSDFSNNESAIANTTSEDESNLFAGMKAKGKAIIDPASIKYDEEKAYHDEEMDSAPTFKKTKNKEIVNDSYDYGAQVRYWADEDASDAIWKELPLKSSMIINSLSSNTLDWNIYAAGTRKSTAYAAHVMEVSDNDTYAEKHTFCYMLDNKYYAVDDANDIFSLSRKYNWMCGRKGMIMFSGNGGTTWYPMSTPTKENLNSISFANTNNGIAVGSNGTILITDDGGQHWEKVNSPVQGPLKCVEMTDANTAYILPLKTEYLKGYVLRSMDAGRTWVKKEFPSQFQTPIMMNSLSFMAKDEIWICGAYGLLFKSKDGGNNWDYQESARGEYRLEDIHMVTHDEGWACGSKGTLLHTKNGGKRWRKVDLGIDYDLYCLEFNGPYMGWVSSRYNLFKLYDDTYDKYGGDFFRKFREPNENWEVQPTPSDNIYVMKAYERFDFASRSVGSMTESSGYGFYLLPATDKALVMGGLLPTEYTDIFADVPFDLSALYRQSSNRFTEIPLNKVNICYSSGAAQKPKLVFLNYELIYENGEQIPQITFKIIYPGE